MDNVKLTNPGGTTFIAADDKQDDEGNLLWVTRCLLYGEHEAQLQRIEDKLDRLLSAMESS